MSNLSSGMARTETNVIDLSQIVNTGLAGITAVLGATERGELRKPKLIRSWVEFQRYYGGLVSFSKFPFYCKRAFDNGGVLLVSRAAHYTDITDPTTVVGNVATCTILGSGGVSVDMIFKAKDLGTWGNRITPKITPSLTQPNDYVNITLSLDGDSQTLEFPVNYTQTDIDKINEKFRYADIDTINTISALPVNTSATGIFSGGSEDYSGLNKDDFEGDENALTGLRAFDDSHNFRRIAVFQNFDNDSDNNITALIAYAELRKVMGLFPAELFDKGFDVVDWRQSITPNPNTWRCRIIYGALNMKNPLTDMYEWGSVIGDAVGKMCAKDNFAEVWYSEAGSKRGVLKDNIGLFYNMGTAARKDEGNVVDQNGITLTIDHQKYGTVLWGNATLWKENTLLKHANVAELIMFLEHSLPEIADRELFDPNDLITWRTIYRNVDALMTRVKAKRGVYDYYYDGDQNIDKIEDAQINDADTIANGGYKYRLFVKPTPAMKYVGIEVVVTKSNVNLNLLSQTF